MRRDREYTVTLSIFTTSDRRAWKVADAALAATADLGAVFVTVKRDDGSVVPTHKVTALGKAS